MVKIGTIIEVITDKGFAYAQYTHKDEMYGALVRVMKGFYEEPQKDLEMLANKPTLFVMFFPVNIAIRRKDVTRIGHHPVPQFAEKLPIFKQGYAHPENGKVPFWTLYDKMGSPEEKSWRVEKLSDEEKNYPSIGICNFPWFKSCIEEEWTPIKDFHDGKWGHY